MDDFANALSKIENWGDVEKLGAFKDKSRLLGALGTSIKNVSPALPPSLLLALCTHYMYVYIYIPCALSLRPPPTTFARPLLSPSHSLTLSKKKLPGFPSTMC